MVMQLLKMKINGTQLPKLLNLILKTIQYLVLSCFALISHYSHTCIICARRTGISQTCTVLSHCPSVHPIFSASNIDSHCPYSLKSCFLKTQVSISSPLWNFPWSSNIEHSLSHQHCWCKFLWHEYISDSYCTYFCK